MSLFSVARRYEHAILPAISLYAQRSLNELQKKHAIEFSKMPSFPEPVARFATFTWVFGDLRLYYKSCATKSTFKFTSAVWTSPCPLNLRPTAPAFLAFWVMSRYSPRASAWFLAYSQSLPICNLVQARLARPNWPSRERSRMSNSYCMFWRRWRR
jgi:hypothetical protein